MDERRERLLRVAQDLAAALRERAAAEAARAEVEAQRARAAVARVESILRLLDALERNDSAGAGAGNVILLDAWRVRRSLRARTLAPRAG